MTGEAIWESRQSEAPADTTFHHEQPWSQLVPGNATGIPSYSVGIKESRQEGKRISGIPAQTYAQRNTLRMQQACSGHAQSGNLPEVAPSLLCLNSERRPWPYLECLSIDTRTARPGTVSHSKAPGRPLPMPLRQRASAVRVQDLNLPNGGTSVTKKDARPKPYILEAPAIAPRIPSDDINNLHGAGQTNISERFQQKQADFVPWFGTHQEDQLSEIVIRQGYYDKSQMTQNEAGTARQQILPSLRQKGSIQSLSSLVTNILSRRRLQAQITSASTFKPPPRLTVTDTRRESWLKDLANPGIPLRRLSRSIPHGIRGKVLLEQALTKHIPVDRSVWLARCVGANELRSFRRKGVSGSLSLVAESKWIREFTVCVEQFLEGLVSGFGQSSSTFRLNYG